ncbi:MAG: SIMPL domain-containing protein [Candidatus Bathyarchaeota archaeon]|nr:SIMPL domain-containing protein [Candidatus Bathyarchaeota archaeon]
MEKTQQVVSVLAVCASILLAGMIITYKPGMVAEFTEFRFPTGVAAGPTYSTVAALDTTATPKTMSITGTGVVNVKTDQATVILGVYTEGKSAGAAIEENAALMTAVISSLKQLGFTDDDMKTTSYGVTPTYNWEIQSVVGYQVTNLIQVKINDLAKVGPTIDAASAAGANRVDSISFGISDATAQTMKLQAYTAAINDAKAKSDVITSGLGVSVKGVQSISESYYYPYTEYRSYDAAVSSSGKASTPVLSGNLSVTVTLNIVYLIE